MKYCNFIFTISLMIGLLIVSSLALYIPPGGSVMVSYKTDDTISDPFVSYIDIPTTNITATAGTSSVDMFLNQTLLVILDENQTSGNSWNVTLSDGLELIEEKYMQSKDRETDELLENGSHYWVIKPTEEGSQKFYGEYTINSDTTDGSSTIYSLDIIVSADTNADTTENDTSESSDNSVLKGFTGQILSKKFNKITHQISEISDSYYSTDDCVISVLQFDPISSDANIEWKWINPSGEIYRSFGGEMKAGCDNLFAYIDIKNNEPASTPGEWRVDFLLNGNVIDSKNFTIEMVIPTISTPVPSTYPLFNYYNTYSPQKECPGNTECGDKCCGPGEGCCNTENGLICYNPLEQVCVRK